MRERNAENLLRRNQDLQQFTYIVSHNLRAPVANLLGLSRYLSQENKDSDKFDLALSKLATSAKHLDMVITDLSKILSPLQNSGNAMEEQVNISAVVNEVVAGLQDHLEPVNAKLKIEIEPTLTLSGSNAYFYSIFNNLISNAIKYRDLARPLEISISQEKKAGKVTFFVADNGSGMDINRIKDQLFQIYKRFHTNTEGRGIGLYLVKTQVETMGGTIQVESTPGAGTTFFITFSL